MAGRKRKIDINRAAADELAGIPGAGPVLVQRIIAARPFRRLTDLKQIPGISDKLYEQLRQYVQIPRKPRARKLDLNSADSSELVSLPGVGPALAQRIDAARPFGRLADLKRVPGIGDKLYDQLRAHLRVPRTSSPGATTPGPVQEKAAAQPASVSVSPLSDAIETGVEPSDIEPVRPSLVLESSPDEVVEADAEPVDIEAEVVGTLAIEALHSEGEATMAVAPDLELGDGAPDDRAESAQPSRASVDRLAPAPEYEADKLADASVVDITLPVTRRRALPWIFFIASAMFVAFLVIGAAALIGRLREPLSTTETPAAQAAEPVEDATAMATSTTFPVTTSPESPAEVTAPPPTRGETSLSDSTVSPTLSPTSTPVAALPTPAATEVPVAGSTPPASQFTLGSVLWREDFNPPAFNWGRGQTAIADAGYTDGTLQAILLTRVEPYWSIGPTYRVGAANYYYEGDVIVETCAEEDFYGLVFRADANNYYLFAITCDGNFRLERRLDGVVDILKVAYSPGVPVGPGNHRLGVLILGKHIALYVNGQMIYDYVENRLDQIPIGSYGVYARAVSTGLLKVRWDNLVATEVLP